MAAQLFSRAVEHDPEIALGDVEPLANFIVGTFFHFVELDHLCHARRQLAKRFVLLAGRLADAGRKQGHRGVQMVDQLLHGGDIALEIRRERIELGFEDRHVSPGLLARRGPCHDVHLRPLILDDP